MLNAQPATIYNGVVDGADDGVDIMAKTARQRYADIFRDVEALVDDHSTSVFSFRQLNVEKVSLPKIWGCEGSEERRVC